MGRARLMEQQRKRRDALKAVKTAVKKKKDYTSGGKPAVTRDTSKDKPKKDYTSGGKPAVTRDTSKDVKPKPKASTPSKPKASTPKPKPKKSTSTTGEQRFYSNSSGTRGQSLPSNPKLKSQPKPKPTGHKGGNRAKVKARPKRNFRRVTTPRQRGR